MNPQEKKLWHYTRSVYGYLWHQARPKEPFGLIRSAGSWNTPFDIVGFRVVFIREAS